VKKRNKVTRSKWMSVIGASISKSGQSMSRFISMALVAVGLAASLASANPQTIEETTLSLRELFSDLTSMEEATAINRGDYTGIDQPVTVSVSNEVMLGPIVHFAQAQEVKEANPPLNEPQPLHLPKTN
jgi:hypothetical protein